MDVDDGIDDTSGHRFSGMTGESHELSKAPEQKSSSSALRRVLGWAVPRIAVFGVAAGITFVGFIQYCDLLFDCGCRPLWDGAAALCNVHNAEPPHCPWCVGDGELGTWSFRAILFGQGLVAVIPGRFGWVRAAAVLLAFPAVGGIGALASGIVVGYWQ